MWGKIPHFTLIIRGIYFYQWGIVRGDSVGLSTWTGLQSRSSAQPFSRLAKSGHVAPIVNPSRGGPGGLLVGDKHTESKASYTSLGESKHPSHHLGASKKPSFSYSPLGGIQETIFIIIFSPLGGIQEPSFTLLTWHLFSFTFFYRFPLFINWHKVGLSSTEITS